MNRQSVKGFTRFLALFLSIALTLPNPAFALRNQQQEDPSQLTGLEEALKALNSDNPAAALQVIKEHIAQAVTPQVPQPPLSAAGLEEATSEEFLNRLLEGKLSTRGMALLGIRQELMRRFLRVHSEPERTQILIGLIQEVDQRREKWEGRKGSSKTPIAAMQYEAVTEFVRWLRENREAFQMVEETLRALAQRPDEKEKAAQVRRTLTWLAEASSKTEYWRSASSNLLQPLLAAMTPTDPAAGMEENRLIRTVEVFTDRAFSIAFSPDGKTAAVGGLDQGRSGKPQNKIKLLDTATGTGWGALEGPLGYVRGLVFDGRKRLVSNSNEGVTRVWDLATGRVQEEYLGQSKWSRSVAVDPQGKILFLGQGDGTVRIRAMSGGPDLQVLGETGDQVTALAVSPDGRWLVSARADRSVRLWVSEGGKFQRFPQDPRRQLDIVMDAAFSPDGKKLALASFSGLIQLFDVETGKLFKSWSPSRARKVGKYATLAFSPGGERLAASSGNSEIRIWRMDRDRPERELTLSHGASPVWVTRLSFSPDGGMLASTGTDGLARFWRIGGSENPVAALTAGAEEERRAAWGWAAALGLGIAALPVWQDASVMSARGSVAAIQAKQPKLSAEQEAYQKAIRTTDYLKKIELLKELKSVEALEDLWRLQEPMDPGASFQTYKRWLAAKGLVEGSYTEEELSHLSGFLGAQGRYEEAVKLLQWHLENNTVLKGSFSRKEAVLKRLSEVHAALGDYQKILDSKKDLWSLPLNVLSEVKKALDERKIPYPPLRFYLPFADMADFRLNPKTPVYLYVNPQALADLPPEARQELSSTPFYKAVVQKDQKFFQKMIEDVSAGLQYVSGKRFGLELKSVSFEAPETWRKKIEYPIDLITAPKVQEQAGKAFVVLMGYPTSGGTHYSGGGILFVRDFQKSLAEEKLRLARLVLNGLGSEPLPLRLQRWGHLFRAEEAGTNLENSAGKGLYWGISPAVRFKLGWPKVDWVPLKSDRIRDSLPPPPKAPQKEKGPTAGLEEDPPEFVEYHTGLAMLINHQSGGPFRIDLEQTGVLRGIRLVPVQTFQGMAYPRLSEPFKEISEEPRDYRVLSYDETEGLWLLNVRTGRLMTISLKGSPSIVYNPGHQVPPEQIQQAVHDILEMIGRAGGLIRLGIQPSAEAMHRKSVVFELANEQGVIHLTVLRDGLLLKHTRSPLGRQGFAGLEELADAARGPVREVAERGERIAVLVESAVVPDASAEDLAAVAKFLRGLNGYPFIEIKPLSAEAVGEFRQNGYQVIQLRMLREDAAADPDTVYVDSAAGLEQAIPAGALPLLITDAVARWQRVQAQVQGRTLTSPIVLPAVAYLNMGGLEESDFIQQILADRFA